MKKLFSNASQDPDNDFAAQLLGYCSESKNRILVYEFATRGSLHDVLHGRERVQVDQPHPTLSWSQRIKIAYGAARGLHYLHHEVQPPIVHRAIKSSNVLLFGDYNPKIADFDLAWQSPDTTAHLHSTCILGTSNYNAPEYALTGKFTEKSDVYSFGVILLELLTGRKPVDRTMPIGQQCLVTWAAPRLGADTVEQLVDPKLNNDYSPWAVAGMAAVAARCLEYKPDFRPKMTNVIEDFQYLLESQLMAVRASNSKEPLPLQNEENGSKFQTLPVIAAEVAPGQVEAEWSEQCEPGVSITLIDLPDGTRVLKRVQFSKKRLGVLQAESWWSENHMEVYEKYNIRFRRMEPYGGV